LYLADPLGYSYSGFGNTGSEVLWLDTHAKKIVNGQFYVGDLAINGHSRWTTVHTFVCKKNGTATTSMWSSFGNENAPDPVKLHYHDTPLLGVWRHPALL
jgi:hypothetical protein